MHCRSWWWLLDKGARGANDSSPTRRTSAPVRRALTSHDPRHLVTRTPDEAATSLPTLLVVNTSYPHSSGSELQKYERSNAKSRHFPWGHATYCYSLFQFVFFVSLTASSSPVARKIPFDNPQVLDYVRIFYVASQAISLAVYYYTSTKVRQLPRQHPPTPHVCTD